MSDDETVFLINDIVKLTGIDVPIIDQKCRELFNLDFLFPGYFRRLAIMSKKSGCGFPELVSAFVRCIEKTAEDFLTERSPLEFENEIFAKLEEKARYALNSHKLSLVCQAYGMAQAFYALDAITKEHFNQLNEMLVVKGINDPAHCHLE